MDYKKELTCAFGDYVEAYEGTTNTSRARSSACIALYPIGNSTGSWALWKIDTCSRVRRTNMDRLVTTERIINIMNALVTEEREVDQGDRTGAEENQAGVPGQTQAETQAENPVANQEEIQDKNPEEGLEAIQEETSEEIAEEIQDESAEEQEIQPRVTTRSGREIIRPSTYTAVTKVLQKEWKQEQATKAIKKELSQLFEELVAIVPIKRPEIPPNATILNSHMFLVNKYNVDGEFEKVKARLVADSRDQDPAMYPDKSSPTVAIHSVFTVLGMAGEKRWWVVMKIDIKGAL